MKARLTITDLTRMQGDRVCVGGYLPDDTCVRPVFRSGGLKEGWLQARGEVIIRPFAVVEFEFKEKRGQAPHLEDRVIDPVYRMRRGMLPPRERHALLQRIKDPSVGEIFGASIYQEPGWYVLAGQGNRSLGTIVPSEIVGAAYTLKAAGGWNYRLGFVDAMGEEYRLSVSDLAFRYFLDSLRIGEKMDPDEAAQSVNAALQGAHVFLRIGLARGWDKYPDRCFLQITGVYSFPDYLGGRCFADLALCSDLPGFGHAGAA
jgi:hypothetical protein